MSTVAVQTFSIESYLALERNCEYKSQYYQGEIFAMPGGTRRHNAISASIIGSLVRQLEKHPRQVFTGDMKIMVEETGLVTYPDAVVACDDGLFYDQEQTVMLNPTVLVEVLSKSTESYDRGEKSRQYRLIPSLREYVLVAQDRPQIERYTRQESGDWLLSEASESGQSVRLESIGCELAIDGVYAKIQFTDAE